MTTGGPNQKVEVRSVLSDPRSALPVNEFKPPDGRKLPYETFEPLPEGIEVRFTLLARFGPSVRIGKGYE